VTALDPLTASSSNYYIGSTVSAEASAQGARALAAKDSLDT